MSDTLGQQLTVHFDYAAPDRMKYQITNGATSIQIGEDDYQQAPNGTWIKNARGTAFAWPDFSYAKVATDAKIESEGSTTVVAFRYNEVDFRVVIDATTQRIVQYSLDTSDTHVTGTYSAFDSAPKIDAPILEAKHGIDSASVETDAYPTKTR